MRKEQQIKNISIEYTNNKQAEEKFIKFIIDYLIDEDLLREDDVDGSSN